MLKHSLPIVAHFDWTLAITFAVPIERLATRLAPGLSLDTHRGFGFVAIACVQTRRLRPARVPAAFGLDFLLVGYRIFTRFASAAGKRYRGLQILGSETDRWTMALGGRLFTHYGYRKVTARVRRADGALAVSTSSGLEVEVREDVRELPPASLFASWEEARRFAGPMPYTFASEQDGRRIVRVQGVRTHWQPRPAAVQRAHVPFLADLLRGPAPAPTAFVVEDVDYRWERGVRESPASP